jgi:hypothetical protein
LTPSRPDAGFPPSDRRPGLPPDQGPQNRHPAASTSRAPLRRKRPAGTQGSGDIDEPSAVTERARSISDRALSEIDAPGPHLTPACGGRLRRPRTEEWPLPDDPRSRRQLGALDPRSPITEEGSTTVPLAPPRRFWGTVSQPPIWGAEAQEFRHHRGRHPAGWRALPRGLPSTMTRSGLARRVGTDALAITGQLRGAIADQQREWPPRGARSSRGVGNGLA